MELEETILIAISPYVKKYYVNAHFSDLPEEINEWLRAKLGALAEKIGATILLGFDKQGEMYLTYRYEDKNFSDEIGAELALKKFKQTEEQVLTSIQAWYTLYHTLEGEKLQSTLLSQLIKDV